MSSAYGVRNPELLTKIILLIFKSNGLLLESGDKLVSNFGLTSSRWQVLGAIYQQPKTVSQIARAMGLTRQSVQRTVDSLKSDQLLATESNPDHARAPLFSLTAKGKTALQKATQSQKEWSTQLAKSQSKDELVAAISVLEKLVHAIEQD